MLFMEKSLDFLITDLRNSSEYVFAFFLLPFFFYCEQLHEIKCLCSLGDHLLLKNKDCKVMHESLVIKR